MLQLNNLGEKTKEVAGIRTRGRLITTPLGFLTGESFWARDGGE